MLKFPSVLFRLCLIYIIENLEKMADGLFVLVCAETTFYVFPLTCLVFLGQPLFCCHVLTYFVYPNTYVDFVLDRNTFVDSVPGIIRILLSNTLYEYVMEITASCINAFRGHTY